MPLRANHEEVFSEMFAAMGPKQREAEILVVTAVFSSYTQGIPFEEGDIIRAVNGYGPKKALEETSEQIDSVAKYREKIMLAQNGYIRITNTKGYLYVLSVEEAKKSVKNQAYETDKEIAEWLAKQ